jgi:hypothetical protein
MNMLIEELGRLSADPFAWGAVALLALSAGYTLWHWQVCPLLHGQVAVDEGAAAEAVDRPLVDGPRFLLLMLGGIAATVTGLGFIAQGIYATAAFYLLLGGLFVIQTEPARREIRQGELRVVAAGRQGEDDRQAALERLRSAHLWLVALHFQLLGATVAGLLAF